MCICFGGSKPILEGFTDADMARDLDGRKYTIGFLFTFAGGAISWQSKLQKCVALSTTEAEYIAATEAGKEMLWMKRFLLELGLRQLTHRCKVSLVTIGNRGTNVASRQSSY